MTARVVKGGWGKRKRRSEKGKRKERRKVMTRGVKVMMMATLAVVLATMLVAMLATMLATMMTVVLAATMTPMVQVKKTWAAKGVAMGDHVWGDEVV